MAENWWAVDPVAKSDEWWAADKIAAAPQSKVAGVVDRFTQGAAFGWGDELTALESAALGRSPDGSWLNYDAPFSERYQRALDAERAQNKQFGDDNRVLAPVAEVAGAVASSVAAPIGLPGRASSTLNAMGRGALEGAGFGAVYGAGDAEGGAGDIVEGAMTGGATGGVAGGALAGIGHKLANRLARGRDVKNAPNSEKLMREGGKILNAERQQNAQFGQFDDFVLDIYQRLGDEALDPQLHPSMVKWVDSVEELATGGTKPTYRQLETLRKRLRTPLGDIMNLEQRRLAMIARGMLDDYMMRQGSTKVRAGRELYRRGKNVEKMEQAATRAEDRAASTYSGGNIENAQRQELRRLLDNKKLSRGFKPEEQAAIRDTLRGGIGQNALRQVGKMSPLRGGVMGSLGMLQGAAAGYAGMPLLAAPAAVGAVAKPLSDRGFQKALKEVTARLALGRPIKAGSMSPEAESIVRALAASAGARLPVDEGFSALPNATIR